MEKQNKEKAKFLGLGAGGGVIGGMVVQALIEWIGPLCDMVCR